MRDSDEGMIAGGASILFGSQLTLSILQRRPFAMGFRRDLPPRLATPRCRLDIETWRRCLAAQLGVLEVAAVVDPTTGLSRKSAVPEEVVARGGGHLCPYCRPSPQDSKGRDWLSERPVFVELRCQ